VALPPTGDPRRCDGAHPAHSDLAAFALGVLDAEDVAHFAGHLECCQRCQDELDEWLAMHERLAGIRTDPLFVDHLLAAEQIHREGDLLDHLFAASARRQRTVKRVRLASLGGSVLVFAVVVVASFGASLSASLAQFW
jgi:hypothetical protein